MNKTGLKVMVTFLFIGYMFYITNQELSPKTIIQDSEISYLENKDINHNYKHFNPLLEKEKDYQKKFLNVNEDFFIYTDIGP